jgi:AcrR family transcriptional regulator
MPSHEPKTRRTEGALTAGRSARVVDDVLAATWIELSRKGYGALRVEDVAERSGVNKTTIYRRWPSKPELVAAAIATLGPSAQQPDTGDVREDLLLSLRELIAFAASTRGRAMLRLIQTEGTDPEVEKIARKLRAEQRSERVKIIRRAIDRGELPASTQADLVSELVFSPVVSRMLGYREPMDDAIARAIVDIVLAGVRAL